MKTRHMLTLASILVIAALSITYRPQIAQAAGFLYDTVVRGTVTLDSGGILDTGSGTLKIAGTSMTSTAAQLNEAGAQASLFLTNATVAITPALATNVQVTIVNTYGWVGTNVVIGDVTNTIQIIGSVTSTATITPQTVTPTATVTAQR